MDGARSQYSICIAVHADKFISFLFLGLGHAANFLVKEKRKKEIIKTANLHVKLH